MTIAIYRLYMYNVYVKRLYVFVSEIYFDELFRFVLKIKQFSKVHISIAAYNAERNHIASGVTNGRRG